MAKDKNIAGAESVFELLNTHYFGIAYTNRFHNLFNIYIILFFPPLNYYSDSISFISKPLPYPPSPPLPSPPLVINTHFPVYNIVHFIAIL